MSTPFGTKNPPLAPSRPGTGGAPAAVRAKMAPLTRAQREAMLANVRRLREMNESPACAKEPKPSG